MTIETLTHDAVISLTPSIELMIDELGALQDHSASLILQIEGMKATIKAMGAGRYLGARWQCLVSDIAESKKTNWQAVAMHFSPSPQLLSAHSTKVDATLRILTTLQKGKS